MTTQYEHELWVRYMQDQGWRYGETYDEAAKTDPKMVPYDQLPKEGGESAEVADALVTDDDDGFRSVLDMADDNDPMTEEEANG